MRSLRCWRFERRQFSGDVFARLQAAGAMSMRGPEFAKVMRASSEMRGKLVHVNAAESHETFMGRLMEAFPPGNVGEGTVVFAPFHVNVGRFVRLGKNVFINHGCILLDMGGITIGDDCMLAPRVTISSETHPVDPARRHELLVKPVELKNNVWLGTGSSVMPGCTIGVNSVVAAGAVVTSNVPDNVVVAGVPAKIIRSMRNS